MMHVAVHILVSVVKILLSSGSPDVVIVRGDSVRQRILSLVSLSSVEQAVVLLVTFQKMGSNILNGTIAFMRV